MKNGADIAMMATALWDAWERACEADELLSTVATMIAEQTAWDELVDYVEANGLNYTKLDPRGPREETN